MAAPEDIETLLRFLEGAKTRRQRGWRDAERHTVGASEAPLRERFANTVGAARRASVLASLFQDHTSISRKLTRTQTQAECCDTTRAPTADARSRASTRFPETPVAVRLSARICT